MKLADYLHRHKISDSAFAALIDVSQAAITRYAAGKRIPRAPTMARIVEVTKGAVTANDFHSAESPEHARVSRALAEPEAA